MAKAVVLIPKVDGGADFVGSITDSDTGLVASKDTPVLANLVKSYKTVDEAVRAHVNSTRMRLMKAGDK